MLVYLKDRQMWSLPQMLTLYKHIVTVSSYYHGILLGGCRTSSHLDIHWARGPGDAFLEPQQLAFITQRGNTKLALYALKSKNVEKNDKLELKVLFRSHIWFEPSLLKTNRLVACLVTPLFSFYFSFFYFFLFHVGRRAGISYVSFCCVTG